MRSSGLELREKDKTISGTKFQKSSGIFDNIASIPTGQIIYMDETGIDTCLCREYGWPERGKVLMGRVSGRKVKRTGIVSAQIEKSTLAP